MNKVQVQKVLAKAAEVCAGNGARLTEKRRAILAVLLRAPVPLSAYEVADEYNKNAEQSMPAMSVYRILDFLVAETLAHKLSSANKYVPCSHITCSHAHEIPQFLICRNCHKVKEVGVPKRLIDELSDNVRSAGFRLMKSQLELDCLCERCHERAA